MTIMIASIALLMKGRSTYVATTASAG